MPDLSLFTKITEVLGITLNELLQGERIIGKQKDKYILCYKKIYFDMIKISQLKKLTNYC